MLSKRDEDKLLKEREETLAKREIIDGRIHGNKKIDRTLQESFTVDIFKQQSEQSKQTTLEEYEKDINLWRKSTNSRTRLVIIEASEQNIPKIAEAIFNASPLERVITTGLKLGLQNKLKNELKKLWSQKLESSKDYQKFFENVYQKNGGTKNWESLLQELTIRELLGPHGTKEDNDIDFAKMSKEFPEFDTATEEVVCYGQQEELFEKLGDLGSKIDSGVPIFSMYTEEPKSWGLGKCAAKDPVTMFDALTAGKSSQEIIGAKNDEDYQHILVNPIYKEQLQNDNISSFMESNGFSHSNEIEQKDLDYLKTILFDEAVYPPNTGPKAITKTISKAGSNIGAGKGEVMKKTLMKNVYDKPESSIVESEFSVGDISSDGGNDIITEKLGQRNIYKKFYEENLNHYLAQGKNPKEAIQWAIAQTIDTYNYVEKKNATVKDLIWGETGAEIWRDYGIHESNKLQNANKKANQSLKPSPYLFGGGVALSAVGLGLTSVASAGIGIPPGVFMGLGITGNSGFTLSNVLKGNSLYHQYRSNKDYLDRANMALALANGKMFDAQRERIAIINKRLNNIKNGIPNKETEQDQIPVATYAGDFQTRKEEYKTRLKDILEKIDGDNDLEIKTIKGSVNQEDLKSFTMDLYLAQAKRTKAGKEEEYSRNLQAWKNSIASRPRLTIIEAEKDNLASLADITINASPLERVLITGLNDELKKTFTEEIKKVWRSKLQMDAATLTQEQQQKSDHYKKEFIKQFCTKNTRVKITDGVKEKSSIIQEAQNYFSENNQIDDQQNYIKEELQKRQEAVDQKWKEYFENNSSNLDNLVENQLEAANLSELLGPHLQQTDLDICHRTLANRFEQFDANVEEVLCYGQSEELPKSLGNLGQNIGKGVPNIVIKSQAIEASENGLWKGQANDPKTFLKEITKGKSAEALFDPQKDGTYKNIILCPSLQKLFDQKEITEGMPQEDLDFFKKIFIEEALYPAETSPEAITKTISKASSKLSAIAGQDVAKDLKWSMIGLPKSTATEVDYAIMSMVKDGGNDLIKEQLDKKNTYKQFYENLRTTLIDQYQYAPELATQKAFAQMAALYQKNEKENPEIQRLAKGDEQHSGAEQWRELGLKYTNKTQKTTQRGLKWANISGGANVAGIGLQIAGVPMMFVPGIGQGVWLGLGITGAALQVGAIGSLYRSTQHMKKANGTLLPIANFAYAEANEKMFQAHQIREACTESYLKSINQQLKTRGSIIQKPTLHTKQNIEKKVNKGKTPREWKHIEGARNPNIGGNRILVERPVPYHSSQPSNKKSIDAPSNRSKDPIPSVFKKLKKKSISVDNPKSEKRGKFHSREPRLVWTQIEGVKSPNGNPLIALEQAGRYLNHSPNISFDYSSKDKRTSTTNNTPVKNKLKKLLKKLKRQ